MIYRVLFLVLFVNIKLYSQSYITDRDWNYHLNLTDVNHLASYQSIIYCFTSEGLFSLDLSNTSILRNLRALELNDMSIISTANDAKYFVLGSSSGLIEIFFDDQKRTLNLNENNAKLDIFSLSIYQDNLYVATSSGLFNISLNNFFIKETYKYLGNGSDVKSFKDVKIHEDVIYVLSDGDIYFFNLNNQNPLDYNLWKNFFLPEDDIIGIFINNQKVNFYSKSSIYNQNHNIFFNSSDSHIRKVKYYNEKVYILFSDNLNRDVLGVLDNNNTLNYISIPDEIVDISDFIVHDDDIWLSGDNYALFNLSDVIYFTPDNSISSGLDNLDIIDNTLYAFSDTNVISISNKFPIWNTIQTDSFSNITSVELHNNKLYLSSKNDGILNITDNVVIDHLSLNSLLKPLQNNDVYVSDLKSKDNNLWVLNYGVENPLLSYDGDDKWLIHNLNFQYEIFPKSFEIINNNLWIIDTYNGRDRIIIYNILSGEVNILSVENGKLLSNHINDIKLDNEGNTWVASDDGLAYFVNSNFNNFLTIPNDGNSYLFKDIKINSIDFDFANNVWIASDKGLFVFNNKKNNLLYHFNKKNSPILSDLVSTIKLNEIGIAYVLTNSGLQSINTSVSKPNDNLENIKIFPNPLKLKEHDRLYFSGLTSNTNIMISSLKGDLVNTFKIEGGGFSWNLLSSKGSKIEPGVFLIFIVSDGKKENLIGKILVL